MYHTVGEQVDVLVGRRMGISEELNAGGDGRAVVAAVNSNGIRQRRFDGNILNARRRWS